ncbi:MAG: hypothetical protein AAF393_04315 [Pseudomonadota bacterium]
MNSLFDGLGPLMALGLMSGVLSTFAYLPYIRDTWAGTTQPQRASWLIWSILSTIAFFSQVYEGATASLWFSGVQAAGTITVFLLSISRGVGGFLNGRDAVVLLVAAGGLMVWYFLDTAIYALATTISISLLGGTVTVIKAYHAPQSETLATWTWSFVASVFALAAVGSLDLVLLAYPAYLFILNGAIVVAIYFGKSRGITVAPAE